MRTLALIALVLVLSGCTFTGVDGQPYTIAPADHTYYDGFAEGCMAAQYRIWITMTESMPNPTQIALMYDLCSTLEQNAREVYGEQIETHEPYQPPAGTTIL